MIAKHPNPCKHEYQDATYGPGFRVMNHIKTMDKEEAGYRCTVCAPLKVKSHKRGGVFRRSELIVKRG